MYWDYNAYRCLCSWNTPMGSAMFIPKRSMVIKNKQRKKRRS